MSKLEEKYKLLNGYLKEKEMPLLAHFSNRDGNSKEKDYHVIYTLLLHIKKEEKIS